MKVGIMQPYFVPYIGYWQLMNAVDKYVIYDDVNYIKGGWINRNRILMNGQPQYFNIPMIGASPFKHINKIEVNHDEKLIHKSLKTLEGAYKKAPYFTQVFPLMEEILEYNCQNIAQYIENSFRILTEYMGIETELILSSQMEKDCSLKGQDKVLAICRQIGATEYYNAIGGQDLYSFKAFKENGIELSFLKTRSIQYTQFGDTFQPNLSIVDVLMFNSVEEVRNMLSLYDLISEGEEA